MNFHPNTPQHAAAQLQSKAPAHVSQPHHAPKRAHEPSHQVSKERFEKQGDNAGAKTFLDQVPQFRDGNPNPTFKKELQQAVSDNDASRVQELFKVARDEESGDVHLVLKGLLDKPEDDPALEQFQACNLPNFESQQMAELIFLALKRDKDELAKKIAGQENFNPESVAKTLDQRVVAENLGADPLLTKIDQFVCDHLPSVEEMYSKALQERKVLHEM